MATDMQPLYSGIPSHSTRAVPDARERVPAIKNPEYSRDFDSLLERADARQTAMNREPASARAGSKPSSQARVAPRSTAESQSLSTDRSTAPVRKESTVGRNDEARPKSEQGSTGKSDGDSIEDKIDQSDDQTTPQQAMILAAMIVPAPTVELPKVQVDATPDSESVTSADAAGKVATATSTGVPNTAPSLATAMSPSVQSPGQTSVGNALPDAAEQSADLKPTPAKGQASGGAMDVSELTPALQEGVLPEQNVAASEVATKGSKSDPERIPAAVAAVTTIKTETKASEIAVTDHADRPVILDAISQDNSLSTGQEAGHADEYPETGSQQFSESSANADRSTPNQSMTNGMVERPLFLDRMNSLNQAAPSSNESGSSRSETWQTASVLRAAESERLTEIRGASPVAQSVMLDLDPLDMGPLRVRVMMSDQTVHAHIRTEHGELGQGLLQQGQSLESSLRTTGLEMGMLRVTVDQQQGRNDNAWMFQQQQQGRTAPSASSHPATGEEERSARGERGSYSSEHVSIFA
ncbi:MAG: flagellar hook-length control protein FliK [Nitrospira sp.]|nr:flagellar hook-length control protein FliK [Nitrospira sp.]